MCLDAICIPPSGSTGCAAPYESCGGGAYCANLAHDSSNCGACGQACPAGEVCNGTGVCAASCVASEALCSGRCVDTLSDQNDCGGCGTACAAGQACSNGACSATCAASYASCGAGAAAYCADAANDPVNCGGCGLTCAPGASCVGGSCTVPCPAPFVTCGGACTDTRYDPGNCGGCGAACAAGDYCDQGACENPAGVDAGYDAGFDAGPRGTSYDASYPAVYAPDAGGQTGLLPGPDGGVTAGAYATFGSDFFYLANSGDGTISRVEVPSAGPPVEQARYFCLVPIDNHGLEPMHNGKDIWQSAGVDQYNPVDAGVNYPAHLGVDRRGSAWVLLPGTSFTTTVTSQPGVTEILDVGDHLADCTPRCHQRHALAPGQSFTEGVPLQLLRGGTITLSPPTVIAPGTSYATTYYCEDVGADPTGLVETDPRNYDDCIKMSIPLGAPNPDPNADPDGLTLGYGFPRSTTFAPNCDPVTGQCDVWIAMWDGLGELRLAYASPYAGGAPYDVAKVVPTGVNPFSNAIDCSGILWTGTVGTGTLGAVTTIPLSVPADGINVPAETLLTPAAGIPNFSSCTQFDIAADLKGRIWLSGWEAGGWICSFDTAAFLADYTAVAAGTLPLAVFVADMNAAWKSYDLAAQYPGGNGRAIAIDQKNDIFESFDEGSASAVAFNPDVVGTVPCNSPNDAGATCPNGSWLWPLAASSGAGNDLSVALDLDANGNVWLGNYGSASAVEFNGTTGAFLDRVPLGDDIDPEPSDFTGHNARSFAAVPGLYSQTFAGCAGGTVNETWETVAYSATVPAGTDLALQVVASATASPDGGVAIPICQSVQNGNCVGTSCTPCGNPIDLAAFNVPPSPYLIVQVTLIPPVCGTNGGLPAPVLYDIAATGNCP